MDEKLFIGKTIEEIKNINGTHLVFRFTDDSTMCIWSEIEDYLKIT